MVKNRLSQVLLSFILLNTEGLEGKKHQTYPDLQYLLKKGTNKD